MHLYIYCSLFATEFIYAVFYLDICCNKNKQTNYTQNTEQVGLLYTVTSLDGRINKKSLFERKEKWSHLWTSVADEGNCLDEKQGVAVQKA